MELLFNARALENAPAKRVIGMHAAQTLTAERTMFIGIGSTRPSSSRCSCRPAEELTVVTGSLPVASLLGTRKGRVVVLGGSVLTDELACVGPVAAATVRRYHADLAVLGAAGLSARHGITELSDEAAEIQRLMVEHTERLVIVADGSKLGQTAMASVAGCRSDLDADHRRQGAPSGTAGTGGAGRRDRPGRPTAPGARRDVAERPPTKTANAETDQPRESQCRT